MPRHHLAALFEPRTILVLADRELPLVQSPPRWLVNTLTFAPIREGEAIQLEPSLKGLRAGARLDQALVCVAPRRLPEALEALRPYRPRSLILLAHEQPSDNFVEDMVYCRSWGALNDCTVLGPRAFGVLRPHLGLNLSHQPRMALGGRVALVAQSRSITSAVLDWAEDVSLGFSAVASVGDQSGVDVSEVLDYLAMDARTDSIALYLEETSSSRRFTSALRAAASVKPVVVLKVGHSVGESSEDAVFSAMLRRVGAVRIRYFVQLFSALKVLVHARRPRGRKIALFSNGGGAPHLALDIMGDNESVFRAELSLTSIKALNEVIDPGDVADNPVVAYARLTPEKVQAILTILADDPGVDGVLVLLSPDPLSDLPAVAKKLAEMAPAARKPIVSCFMGDASMRPLRQLLDSVGTPAFRTPESAANAFGILGSYHYNQSLSLQTLPPEPLGKPPHLEEARALVHNVQSQRRRELDPDECRRLLECFFVPVVLSTAEQAVDCAIPDDMASMVIRVDHDDKFGPYITFGAGSQDALLARSARAVELPPLNRYLARKLVQRSSLWPKALSRKMTPTAFEDLLEALENISQLVSELPGVESLVIDPLYATDVQLVAHAIHIELRSESMLVLPETTGYRHMAIHPYPRRLVQAKTFKDGQPWLLRPIRPEDAEPLQEFVRGLSDEARYMRFVSMLRELTPRMLARYTRIDYDRELALVATVQAPNPEHRGHLREQIIGFAHYLRNADGRGAEYALVIADAWQRRGLGTHLMGGLIDAAEGQGLTYIEGVVLASNRPMLGLMMRLGFQNDPEEDDPSMRRVWLDLGESRRR